MVKHTLYEDAPARVEIEFEYDETNNEVYGVKKEIIDVEDTNYPVLYCECGKEFEDFESAESHLREVRQ